MGNRTPSSRRREGRNAFCPGEDPNDACPYKNTSWNAWRDDWIEGWNESLIAYEREMQEAQEESDKRYCQYCGQLLP